MLSAPVELAGPPRWRVAAQYAAWLVVGLVVLVVGVELTGPFDASRHWMLGLVVALVVGLAWWRLLRRARQLRIDGHGLHLIGGSGREVHRIAWSQLRSMRIAEGRPGGAWLELHPTRTGWTWGAWSAGLIRTRDRRLLLELPDRAAGSHAGELVRTWRPRIWEAAATERPSRARPSPVSGIDLGSPPRLVTRNVVALVLGAALVVAAVAVPAAAELRIAIGLLGLVVAIAGPVLGQLRDTRPSRLFVDQRGIRLRNRRDRDLTDVAWADLAGVGLFTGTAGRRRRSVWLELYPAGVEAYRRHPELEPAWKAGRPPVPGEKRRWLLLLSEGIDADSLPVEAEVRQWRPGLWRGHRSGAVPGK